MKEKILLLAIMFLTGVVNVHAQGVKTILKEFAKASAHHIPIKIIELYADGKLYPPRTHQQIPVYTRPYPLPIIQAMDTSFKAQQISVEFSPIVIPKTQLHKNINTNHQKTITLLQLEQKNKQNK